MIPFVGVKLGGLVAFLPDSLLDYRVGPVRGAIVLWHWVDDRSQFFRLIFLVIIYIGKRSWVG
jgi:hypothetical protein